MYNDKVQVPFEDELNRFIRTEVTENPYLYFFLLRPFDNFFLRLLPLFYHWRGKMQLASLKNGEGQVCVLLNTQNSSLFIFSIISSLVCCFICYLLVCLCTFFLFAFLTQHVPARPLFSPLLRCLHASAGKFRVISSSCKKSREAF